MITLVLLCFSHKAVKGTVFALESITRSLLDPDKGALYRAAGGWGEHDNNYVDNPGFHAVKCQLSFVQKCKFCRLIFT